MRGRKKRIIIIIIIILIIIIIIIIIRIRTTLRVWGILEILISPSSNLSARSAVIHCHRGQTKTHSFFLFRLISSGI